MTRPGRPLMPPRPPDSPLSTRLLAVYGRVRRALVMRHALRASAAAVVLLAAAVTLGLTLPPSLLRRAATNG